MNYRTRSILISTLSCLCIAGISLAAFLYFKNQNKSDDEKDDKTAMEESADGNDFRSAHAKRMRERRANERARNNRIIKVVEKDPNLEKTPEEIREEFRKGLEDYRKLPPEERARWDQAMLDISDRILDDGVPRVIEGIQEADPQQLSEFRDQFTQVTEFIDTTLYQADLTSMLTPEEDQTIGYFLRSLGTAHDEVHQALYNN